jgi:hypothetical protein
VPRIIRILSALDASLGITDLALLISPPQGAQDETGAPADVRKRIGEITDDEHLTEVVRVGTEYCQQEADRDSKIDSKASSVLTASGLSATIMLSALGLITNSLTFADGRPVRALLFVLVMIVFSAFGVALTFAMRVLEVGLYKYTSPNPDDALRPEARDTRLRKVELAADLFYSAKRNQSVGDTKATYLWAAQVWFRNALTLAVCTTLVATGMMLFRPDTRYGGPTARYDAIPETPCPANGAPSTVPGMSIPDSLTR